MEDLEVIKDCWIPTSSVVHLQSNQHSLPTKLLSIFTLSYSQPPTAKMKATFVVSVMIARLAMASPAQVQPTTACKVDNDCKLNELCNNVGLCIPKKTTRDATLAKVGQACQSTNDCVKGLVCDLEKNACDVPNTHNKRGVSDARQSLP